MLAQKLHKHNLLLRVSGIGFMALSLLLLYKPDLGDTNPTITQVTGILYFLGGTGTGFLCFLDNPLTSWLLTRAYQLILFTELFIGAIWLTGNPIQIPLWVRIGFPFANGIFLLIYSRINYAKT